MRVKLRSIMAGPQGIFHPGEHDFSDELAMQLIEAEAATPVDDKLIFEDPYQDPSEEVKKQVETAAVVTPAETAVVPAPKPGKPKAPRVD